MPGPEKVDPRAFEQHWSTRALRALDYLYAHVWHSVRVASPCPIPKRGPAILVCNHSAGIDPLLLQATCPRLITWMMAREYYDLPVLKPIFERLGYIPVNRGTRESTSLKAGLRTLAAGKVLGIFPEGKIEPTLDLLPFQDGVALMAQRANVPVYPAYIAGLQRGTTLTRDLVIPQTATIRYGEAIIPDSTAVTTADVWKSVNTLRLQAIARSPLHARGDSIRSGYL